MYLPTISAELQTNFLGTILLATVAQNITKLCFKLTLQNIDTVNKL